MLFISVAAYYHFALLLYFVLFSNLPILLQAAQDQTRGEHDVVARATSLKKYSGRGRTFIGDITLPDPIDKADHHMY